MLDREKTNGFRFAAKHPLPSHENANFRGNHAVTTEMDIPISHRWMVDEDGNDIVTSRAAGADSGPHARSGFCTFCRA